MEVPEDKKEIIVGIEDRILPIQDLGTGIHEVVILAVAATVLEEQILCIEEPELHLHPVLQRKLIRYLQAKTNNQYFFTTHSAHLLDTPDTAIFHVREQEGVSTIEVATTTRQRAQICSDLGYLASDLLQANCVIWVEGPSDRIYLNHWINSADDRLIEGIHYSIMFYGGRLLSHLSASDPDVTDFISLRRLNRYLTIVIDSDKNQSRDRINDTKRRVRDEFDAGPGFAWITKGREIENYLSVPTLTDAVKRVHPTAAKLQSVGQFDQVLHFRNKSGRLVKNNIDKVKIAHEVAQNPADLSILDLRHKISRLVDFIKDSNDVDPYFLD